MTGLAAFCRNLQKGPPPLQGYLTFGKAGESYYYYHRPGFCDFSSKSCIFRGLQRGWEGVDGDYVTFAHLGIFNISGAREGFEGCFRRVLHGFVAFVKYAIFQGLEKDLEGCHASLKCNG